MFCENCGTQCADNLSTCPNCGAALKSPYQAGPAPAGPAAPTGPAPQTHPGSSPAPAIARGGSNTAMNIPPEYTPITMWGYFGYKFLFAVPVVGLILLIVFAVSAQNKNLKNFARSYFCDLIIACVITAIVLVILLATGSFAALTAYFSDYYPRI